MLRRAKVGDIKEIHKTINESSGRGEMLPRSLMDLYSHVRDFFVYLEEDHGPIIGICAIHIYWENLAEVRSLYVREEYRGKGIARKLVEACMSEAVTLDLFKIFALTYQKDFFEKLGFSETKKETLPEKIWNDCFKCPKYPDYCDETAVVVEL